MKLIIASSHAVYCKFPCSLLQTLAVRKLLGEAWYYACWQVFEETFFFFFPFFWFYKTRAYSKYFCHTKMKRPSSQDHSWNKTPEYFILAEVGMPGCFVHEWLEGRRIFFQICLIKMPLQFPLSFISIGFQGFSKQSYTGLYFKCAVKTW